MIIEINYRDEGSALNGARWVEAVEMTRGADEGGQFVNIWADRRHLDDGPTYVLRPANTKEIFLIEGGTFRRVVLWKEDD